MDLWHVTEEVKVVCRLVCLPLHLGIVVPLTGGIGDCLIVEDAIAGIDAGINGGFKTAAIGDATKYDKPDYKLNKLSDLLDICK